MMETNGNRIDVGEGWIELVDVYGSDKRIVDAARISYGNHRKSTDPVKDEGLIRYLMRHRHTSPFEQCEMTFVVRVPMDTWRQWIRHRMANVNEYSTRYTEAIDQMATTSPGAWRSQSRKNNQGSAETLGIEIGQKLSNEEDTLHKHARAVYEERINRGVAREQARKDLPLSTFTEAYWKCDLHNLLHFLELRMDEHAQLEIRRYAIAIAGLVQRYFPMTWRAFCDYRLHATTFTGPEVAFLLNFPYTGLADMLDRVTDENGKVVGLSKREITELRNKLERFVA